MRIGLISLMLLLWSVSQALAQAPAPPAAQLAVDSGSASLTATHTVIGSNFPANTAMTVVLFDPVGDQLPLPEQTDSGGGFTVHLAPPGGFWKPGNYRLAAPLAGGMSTSATFFASDGQARLFAQPYLPSPNSAFVFVGVGLPGDREVTLQLLLTGGQQGQLAMPVHTDGDGNFIHYVWPEQLNAPFWAAGDYRVTVPELGLDTVFRVREHPVSASITAVTPLPAAGSVTLRFNNYVRDRYLWGLVASLDGQKKGEFLLGPTDLQGHLESSLALPSLPSGRYLVATPYEWGETSFEFLLPTATSTATATFTPTASATATPVRHKKKHRKKKHRLQTVIGTPDQHCSGAGDPPLDLLAPFQNNQSSGHGAFVDRRRFSASAAQYL